MARTPAFVNRQALALGRRGSRTHTAIALEIQPAGSRRRVFLVFQRGQSKSASLSQRPLSEEGHSGGKESCAKVFGMERMVRSIVNRETEMRNTETTNEMRELTQDELTSATGGFFWAHIARTAAVLVAGGVTVIREAMTGTLNGLTPRQ